MPLDETDLKYLWDMLDAAGRVVEYTAGIPQEAYLAERMRRDAVERAVEIVGEAARRVSEAGRAHAPDVSWGPIVATRHILAHEYGDIDHALVWRIATVHVPPLIKQLQAILDRHPPPPESRRNPAEP